jgi:hypothetical protein
MFAKSEHRYLQVHGQMAPRETANAASEPLRLLLTIAAILLASAVALRTWTAENEAKLPPIEYARHSTSQRDVPPPHELRPIAHSASSINTVFGKGVL